MKKLISIMVFFVAGIALFGASTAQAHEIPANIFSMSITDSHAQAMATPSAQAFAFADTNNDGMLNLDEVNAERDAINDWVMEAIVVTLDGNTIAEPTFIDVLVHEPEANNDFLIVRLTYSWEASPDSIEVDYQLWGADTIPVAWSISDRELGEQRQGTLSPSMSEISVRTTTSVPFNALTSPLASSDDGSIDNFILFWGAAMMILGLAAFRTRNYWNAYLTR